MAEQRVVLEAIARRTDLVAPDPGPEPPRMRNVTMIPPGRGCVVTRRAPLIRISDQPCRPRSV